MRSKRVVVQDTEELAPLHGLTDSYEMGLPSVWVKHYRGVHRSPSGEAGRCECGHESSEHYYAVGDYYAVGVLPDCHECDDLEWWLNYDD